MFIHKHTYQCILTYMYTNKHISKNTRILMYVHNIYIHVLIYISIYEYIYIYIYYVYTCIYICIYSCTYLCMNINTNMYKY